MERLCLALNESQSKVFCQSKMLHSGEKMLDRKEVWTVSVSLSLEFSRLPAMLSPLKTTLLPMPALTPRRQIGECFYPSNSEVKIA